MDILRGEVVSQLMLHFGTVPLIANIMRFDSISLADYSSSLERWDYNCLWWYTDKNDRRSIIKLKFTFEPTFENALLSQKIIIHGNFLCFLSFSNPYE